MESRASTVRQVSFDEVCQRAQVIVEGQVMSAESRRSGLNGRIYTYVDIEILDQIKGDPVASPLRLRFTGGSVDGRTLDVADLRIPIVGESGLFFIESLQYQLTNPLVGWSQGLFLYTYDPTTAQTGVFTDRGLPVIRIDRGIKGQAAISGRGTAAGVRVGALSVEQAMSPMELKAIIRTTVLGSAEIR